MEYFGVFQELFGPFLLISFRSNNGILSTSVRKFDNLVLHRHLIFLCHITYGSLIFTGVLKNPQKVSYRWWV